MKTPLETKAHPHAYELKNLFVIGDVHGCYYTAKSLVELYWRRDKEQLVQVGDLLNKGKHPLRSLRYFKSLREKYPDKVVLLKGNNEHLMADYYHKHPAHSEQYFAENKLDFSETLNWIENLPLKYERENLLISHAGISALSKDPYNLDKRENLLFTRGPLRDIGKTQVVGHVIQKEVTYNPDTDVWHIDTGAGNGEKLSGIKITAKGKVKTIFSLPVSYKDVD